MSPVYLNPQQTPSITFLDLKGDQQHSLPTNMGYVHDHVSSINNSYFSGSNLSHHYAPTEFLAMDYSRSTQEKVVEKLILSHDKPFVYPFDHGYQGDHNNKTDEKPKKCKPSKLRIMQRASTTDTPKSKKMIAGDHKRHYEHHLAQPKQSETYRKTSNEANNNGIRMCSDCHTTTTPLWRSGPQGPKSLCNACGIRQRKARRAAMAAMAAAKDSVIVATSPMSSTTTFESPKLIVEDLSSKMNQDDLDKSHTLPLKKRSKTFDNASWSYNNNNDDDSNNNNNNVSHNEDYSKATSQRVFPKDEEEGAILLMALSCGLALSS